MIGEVIDNMISSSVLVDGRIRPRKLRHWIKDISNRRHLSEVTAFLPDEATHHERAYCIQEQITSRQVCAVCDNYVTFVNGSKGYRSTCSKECGRVNPATQTKRQNTVRERYGVDHYSQTDEFAKSYSDTCMDRYGVDDIKQTTESRSRAHATMVDRYGGYTLQSDALSSKVKSTIISKYGVEHPMLNQDIVDKRTATNIVKYGSPSPQSDPTIKAKSIATMVARYGVEHPMQMEDFHAKYIASSNDNFGKDHWNQQHMSDSTLTNINDVDWLRDQHVHQRKSISTIAMELGDITVAGLVPKFHQFGIDIQRYRQSSLEVMVCNWLDSQGVSYRINDRTLIKPQELDVFLPDHNIAIEINGLYWHSSVHPHIGPTYHSDKALTCLLEGISLITIFEDDFNDGMWEAVLQDAILANSDHTIPDTDVIIDARYMHRVSLLLSHNFSISDITPPSQYKQFENVYDCGYITMQKRN